MTVRPRTASTHTRAPVTQAPVTQTPVTRPPVTQAPVTESSPAGQALTVAEVSKRFGRTAALSDVSLEIAPGEAVGLLGPNGAGKTTLLSLITGQRSPTRGRIRVFGADPRLPAARRRLGVTPQATSLPETLKVREVLDFVAAHYSAPLERDELLADLGLSALAARSCGGLSGGQQRRVMLAIALIGNPELLVLDEPTTGLDITSRAHIWQRIQAFTAAGGTLLVSSHQFDEIERLTSRVIMAGEGRIIADDTLASIRRTVDVRRITLQLTPAAEAEPASQPEPTSHRELASLPTLASLPGIISAHIEGETAVLTSSAGDETVRALVRTGIPFSELTVTQTSLEETFALLTSHSTPQTLAS